MQVFRKVLFHLLSFPRRRESRRRLGLIASFFWIPAFAGMTLITHASAHASDWGSAKKAYTFLKEFVHREVLDQPQGDAKTRALLHDESLAFSRPHAPSPLLNFYTGPVSSFYVTGGVGQGFSPSHSHSNDSYSMTNLTPVSERRNSNNLGSSPRDMMGYVNAIKPMSKILLQGQAGFSYQKDLAPSKSAYALFNPINHLSNTETKVCSSSSNAASGLMRFIYSDFDHFAPYVEMGALYKFKRQEQERVAPSLKLHHSRISYQVGAGMRLFSKGRVQAGLGYFYLTGKHQKQSSGVNVDVRYLF